MTGNSLPWVYSQSPVLYAGVFIHIALQTKQLMEIFLLTFPSEINHWCHYVVKKEAKATSWSSWDE